MDNLCIIPARGGSKRIPQKNIRAFLGKPIIGYSIEAALKSGLFTEVMVSTDDPKIAEIAQQLGAKVPFFRSKENSNDFATTMDAVNEVLNSYFELGKKFDRVCCIYPTAPLVNESALKEGFLKLVEEDFDSVLPVVVFSFPIWRSLKFDGEKVTMNWPENAQKRSQDLPAAYHDAGQWYWFNPARIGSSLLTDNTGAVTLSEAEVQDIDTESDWQLAELKYEKLRSASQAGL
jgi:pseudaminic acid cytidylyltransferase